MTPRIKPGSHRELIFQEIHNRERGMSFDELLDILNDYKDLPFT